MMMDKLRVMCRVPCEDELMNEGRKESVWPCVSMKPCVRDMEG